MKNFISKYGYIAAAFAIIVATQTSNLGCAFIFHQPVLPDAVKKLRKF